MVQSEWDELLNVMKFGNKNAFRMVHFQGRPRRDLFTGSDVRVEIGELASQHVSHAKICRVVASYRFISRFPAEKNHPAGTYQEYSGIAHFENSQEHRRFIDCRTPQSMGLSPDLHRTCDAALMESKVGFACQRMDVVRCHGGWEPA